jgi:hypothetical protein
LKIQAQVEPLAGKWMGMPDEIATILRPLGESLMQTSEKLQSMATALEATLASTRMLLDPRAPIAVDLRAGLKELYETARSTRALFELLERDPGSLLRGKGASAEERR